MNVVLISIYELGRQPFSLSSPAAWLAQTGCDVACVDLAVESFSQCRSVIASADLIAFSLPMHTATRLAGGLVQKVRGLNADAHLCFYGLYAPLNEDYLRSIGGETLIGGEFEQGLVSLVKRLMATGENGTDPHNTEVSESEPLISLSRQKFLVPDRSRLPPLYKYAQLQFPSGRTELAGYTEASRGCKHSCRHCPVVPVYRGTFRIVQGEVVLADIRQLVSLGAGHITFGDPDFFNGPGHAIGIVQAIHREFPDLTYDVTIKIEHILQNRQLLSRLRDTGCLFITTAVESIDQHDLEIYGKHHTKEDFVECVQILRSTELQINPTFIAFSPWTTVRTYLDFLNLIVNLDLIENVAPIQYALRLLIPASSKLLELDEVRSLVGKFDQQSLVYPWLHREPAVDELQCKIMTIVQLGLSRHENRRSIFRRIWELAQQACGGSADQQWRTSFLDQAPPRASIPYLTEPWYC
ncbi:MAG: CUAEP/CCAEP-tail radical SAM protein [Candidatus Korobacteraceae bacterium]